MPLHPYAAIHYQPSPWTRPVVPACRARALVVTSEPAQVTCPRCQEALARFAQLRALLSEDAVLTLPLPAVEAELRDEGIDPQALITEVRRRIQALD